MKLMDLISVLTALLQSGKLDKNDLGGVVELLRKIRLAKIGRRYVRLWDYTDIVGKDRPISRYPYIIKLATRLERGKLLKDPVLYAQGVLGLMNVKNCDSIEGIKFLSQVYARDQMSPIHLNELLITIPTACVDRISDENMRILQEFFDSIREGRRFEHVWLVPRIHASVYDRFIKYLKGLSNKYRYVVKHGDEGIKRRIVSLVEQKRRTKFDKIRALVRACPDIELMYEEVKKT